MNTEAGSASYREHTELQQKIEQHDRGPHNYNLPMPKTAAAALRHALGKPTAPEMRTAFANMIHMVLKECLEGANFKSQPELLSLTEASRRSNLEGDPVVRQCAELLADMCTPLLQTSVIR